MSLHQTFLPNFNGRSFYAVRALRFLLCLGLVLRLAAPSLSQIVSNTVVIDDFESGVERWTRNDQVKTDNPDAGVLLVDVTSTGTAAGGFPGSSGAGLFSFKTASNSWASASTRVSGAQWAKIGAQRISFWLNADGAQTGTELVLRASYRQSDGTLREESFSVPVRLNNKSWRRVVIPLADIKNANGALLPRLAGVYLLQFVQRGSWDSRFFTIDQLQVEGTGTPLEITDPSASLGGTSTQNPVNVGDGNSPAKNASATADDANAVRVSVDFLRRQAGIRTAANVSVGATLPGVAGASAYPLQGNAAFRRAITMLAPRVIRLDAVSLTELIDSSRPSFNFSRLAASVRQVRALRAEPMLVISVDPTWGLDVRSYTIFATGAARAVNAGNAQPVRLFELATGSGVITDANAVAWFNSARAGLKAISASYRVGGIAASSGNLRTTSALLRSAQGLDFLSVAFFGGNGSQPGEALLFSSARTVSGLRATAALLDRSKHRNAPLYVTQASINATRDPNTLIPLDARTAQMISGAWWATFLGSSSRLADQVFHNDATNPEWGLLDERAYAFPSYYVMWMWNKFIPNGSTRVVATALRGTVPSDDVSVVAVNTATAHNVMLANTRSTNTTVKLSIRGFPVLRSALMHVLDEAKVIRQSVPLPKSPFQTIVLRPYSVAVIQFIEPPRKSPPAKPAPSKR